MENGPICAGLSETCIKNLVWGTPVVCVCSLYSCDAPKRFRATAPHGPPLSPATEPPPQVLTSVSPSSLSHGPPAYPVQSEPLISEPPVFSPVELQLGSKLDWLLSHRPSLPLELAYVIGGITRVHFPFSRGNFGVCKERSGRFLENTAKFRD